LQKEQRGGGGRKKGFLLKNHQNDAEYFFFFKKKKKINQTGIFVTLHIQNDVVLGIPSIFIVITTGGGHFIRGW
jgi:hypothetical protein